MIINVKSWLEYKKDFNDVFQLSTFITSMFTRKEKIGVD